MLPPIVARLGGSARKPLAYARTRRGRRLFIGGAIALALYALIGFIALPALMHSKLERAAAEALHRPVHIERLYFNPFALSFALKGLRIDELPISADPSAPQDAGANAQSEFLLNAEEAYANVSLGSLLRGTPVLDGVRLVRPHLRLRRDIDRRYNVQDLIDEWRNKPESDPTRFTLSDLEVSGGRIDFDDRYTDEKHAVTDLDLGVPFLSNLPSQADVKVQPKLSALINGAPLTVQGESRPFKDTNETLLRFRLDKLQLAKYADYVPARLHFAIAAGELDGDLQLRLITSNGALRSLTLSGVAALEKLELQQLSGDRILSIPLARAALESYDFVANEMRLSHLSIEGPDVQLMRYKDGRLNLVALSAAPIPSPAKPPSSRAASSTTAPKPPFRFHIANGTLQGGTLRLRDISNERPYQAQLNNVAISLRDLGSGKQGEWQLSFNAQGSQRLEGEGKLALAPLVGSGNLRLKNWQLESFLPYYGSAVNFELRKGLLDGQTRFHFASGDPFQFKLENMDLTLRDAQIGTLGEREPALSLPQLDIKDANVDVTERRIEIALLSGSNGKGRIKRNKAGRVEWTAGTPKTAPAATAQAPDASTPAPAWKSSFKKISLKNFALDYEDQSTVQPVKVSATYIDLDAENASLDAEMRATLKAMLNKTGTLSLEGPLRLRPFSGTLNVEARGIDLVQFQPYWRETVKFDLKRGNIGTRGQLRVAQTTGKTTVGYQGGIRVGDVHAAERNTGEELLSWRSLLLRGFSFNSAPFKAAAERITLSDFYSRLVLGSDGTLNVQRLRADKPVQAAQTATAPSQQSTPTPEAPKRVFEIGGIELRNGKVSFADYFVKPNYSAELTKVEGTISAMRPEKPGEVDIHAAVNGNAPVTIQGLVNPLAKELFLDLQANARDVDLPPLSPYTIKYAGYGIERGKLSFKAHYRLENRQLQAENQLFLDQLTFGERRSGEGGPNLPVHLAVALLKDRNGVIDVKLPISGSLDDPEFSMGGLVVRMFLNLIFKAVTSPFALIGSVFGDGGSEELSYVEFDPGAAKLDAQDVEKLEKLSTALNERPGLKLDIAGRVDPATDREGLARAELQRRMKLLKAREISASKIDEMEIAPGEYEKYLGLVYQDSDLPNKPRNLIGMSKDVPKADMEKLLLANFQSDEEQLRALANARAQAAQEWLLEHGAPRDRLFLVAPRLDAEGVKEGSPSRVDFALR
ncbi:MAG TPA: DUF748 domain-containing protein [Burkholderiales bacterium]|nr:DUF748 domain-containing protein [Burkholderiales bacterium]